MDLKELNLDVPIDGHNDLRRAFIALGGAPTHSQIMSGFNFITNAYDISGITAAVISVDHRHACNVQGHIAVTAARIIREELLEYYNACLPTPTSRLHPLATKRQTSPRRVQRSARGLGVPRLSPVTLPYAWQNVGTSVSTAILSACHPTNKQTSQHCRNPLIPPGSALPSLPITASGQHCHSR